MSKEEAQKLLENQCLIEAVLNENSKYEFIIKDKTSEDDECSDFTYDVCEKIKYWIPFYLTSNMEQLMSFINKVNASFKGNVHSNCNFQNEDHLELIEEAFSESGLDREIDDMNFHIQRHNEDEFKFSSHSEAYIEHNSDDRKKVADDINEFLAIKKRIEESFDSLEELKSKKWKENKGGLKDEMMTKLNQFFGLK